MGFKKKFDNKLDADITPLVDVIFLLLIFFMVGYSQRDQVMEVNLPSSSYSKDISNENSDVDIYLKKNEQIIVNKQEIKKEKLENYLKNIDKSKNINLRADKDISYQKIVDIMAVLGKLEFKKLSLSTEKKVK